MVTARAWLSPATRSNGIARRSDAQQWRGVAKPGVAKAVRCTAQRGNGGAARSPAWHSKGKAQPGEAKQRLSKDTHYTAQQRRRRRGAALHCKGMERR